MCFNKVPSELYKLIHPTQFVYIFFKIHIYRKNLIKMNALRVPKPLLQSAAWRLHVAIVLVSDYVCASNVRKAFLVFISLIALQLHTACGNKIKNTLGQRKIDSSFKPMVSFMLTQKRFMLLLLFDSNIK